MEMDIVTSCCLVLLSLTCALRVHVHGELLPRLGNLKIIGHTDKAVIQDVSQVRVKRNAPSDEGRASCGCKMTPEPSQGPNIVVHHYHHYYYCCPDIADQLRRNPKLAQAVGLNQPRAGQNVSGVAGSMTCECTVTGYCSCGVNCQCHHEEPKPTPTPNPSTDNSKAFGFGLMYNHPTGKQFFDFMSKNFMRKETPQQGNACCGQSASIGFDDPVCKEFFEFFSKNFVRKPETQTLVPTQPPTPAPTQPTNQGPKVFFQEVKNADMKNVLDGIKSMMSNFGDNN